MKEFIEKINEFCGDDSFSLSLYQSYKGDLEFSVRATIGETFNRQTIINKYTSGVNQYVFEGLVDDIFKFFPEVKQRQTDKLTTPINSIYDVPVSIRQKIIEDYLSTQNED